MNQLKPVPPRVNLSPHSHVDPALQTNSHVFIRQDRGVRKPQQQPYKGLFRVIACMTKHYTVEVNGKNKIISVHRLKPAYH